MSVVGKERITRVRGANADQRVDAVHSLALARWGPKNNDGQ